jgi:TRAP-type C4-dicarboxylate transport system permease small subunit
LGYLPECLRKVLRILAVLVLLAALAFWAARGANPGWTVNNIAHETPDPVTGLSGVTYEKGFIPGWDFLAAAALAAGVMAGASFLFGAKKAGS